MNTRTRLSILLIGASLGMGCSAGARVVRTDSKGGELELWGPTGTAAARGREALIDHCNGAYVVSEHGASLGLGRSAAALPQGSTADPKVQRIAFRCKKNGAVIKANDAIASR